jgi:exosortase K
MKGLMYPSMSSYVSKVERILRQNGLFYLLGFLAAFGLKYHYSTASAEGLCWMLKPVARLVALLSGIDFHWVLRAGYVNNSHEVVIAPACAGINFMIICFATFYFTFVARLQGTRAKCSWLAISLATAYLLTLCTNTIRIIVSIYLYGAPIYSGWVTPGRVHQLAGTLIYVSFLVAIFLAMERMMRCCTPSPSIGPMTAAPKGERSPSMARLGQVPFAWYALMTIFVPLLNGAVRRNGSLYAEHAALVVATALFVNLLWFAIASMFKKRIDILNKTKEKGEYN